MNSKEVVISVFSTVFKIVLAIIIVMLVYKWSMTAYEYGQRVFNEPPMSAGSGRTVTFIVQEGDSAKEIGANLEKNGLIRDAALFRIQEMLSAYKGEMLPGTYELNTSMTTDYVYAGGGRMIVDERMTVFIDSMDTPNTEFLNQLEKYSKETNVPIIRPSMQSFLKLLLAIKQPKKILEVGTAIGFSALLMSEYGPEDCHITTIEKYEKRIPLAKENFVKAGKEDRITLLEGDAVEILKELDGTYDFIFMDAAKGQYIHFLPDILRLLADGGMLVSDNVLQDGDIIESRFAVTRRNRTIHGRMRDYLYELKHHPDLVTSILPVGDGVTVSVKQPNKDVKK